MPDLVEDIMEINVYTLWDFAAEFGGYIGTFLGYCVLDLADMIVDVVPYLFNLVL